MMVKVPFIHQHLKYTIISKLKQRGQIGYMIFLQNMGTVCSTYKVMQMEFCHYQVLGSGLKIGNSLSKLLGLPGFLKLMVSLQDTSKSTIKISLSPQYMEKATLE